jgi:hypothetical protein
MTFPVVGSNIPSSYQISNSLRFNDGDTPYLTRSTGTTNKRTFTVSVWAKRSTTGARQTLWSSDNNTNDTGDGTKGGSGNYISFWNNGEFMFGGFGGSFQIRGDGLQRDIAGWYHIVAQTDTTQATTNDRGKLWINGVQQTTYTSMIGQNIDVKWATNRIGVRSDQANYSDPTFFTAYMDGYLAELHVVDGQALTASDFGEYDEDSGIWKPKQYAGTYGTDGYYLKFNNSGNMGEDSSGNDNTFTPVNLSGTTDVTTDTPTNNFATLSPLQRSSTSAVLSEGNCKLTNNTTSNPWQSSYSTIGMNTGKWYWEYKVDSQNGSIDPAYGIVADSNTQYQDNTYGNLLGQQDSTASSYGISFYGGSGEVYYSYNGGFGQTSAFGGHSVGDIICVAVDFDNDAIYFSVNGTYVNSGDPTSGASRTGAVITGFANNQTWFAQGQCYTSSDSISVNFGNAPYSISSGNSDGNGYGNFEYAPPSGYLALCTQNLATALSPTIDDGSQYFNTITYTANRTARSLTGVGFQPDWVWIKDRGGLQNHALFDSNRGVNKQLRSDTRDAELTAYSDLLTSFDSDGFSLGADTSVGDVNYDLQSHVAWNWLAGGTAVSNTDGSITSSVSANTTAGFSIVTYTGDAGTGSTVGHGLGVAPKVVIVKPRNGTTAYGWRVYTEMTGNTNYLLLDSADASTAFTDWNNTSPTSSVFTVNSSSPQTVNESGTNYVAYCFAEIEGYSKFGSYKGNGNTDGPFIYTGFKPAWIMVKGATTAQVWSMRDNKRDSYNSAQKAIYANRSDAESDNANNSIDLLSNGFKIRNLFGTENQSGQTFIYMAFAENPFVTSGATPVTAR